MQTAMTSRESHSATTDSTPSSYWLSTALAMILATLATTVIFVILPSQNPEEVPENALIGLAIGAMASGITVSLWLLACLLLHGRFAQSRRRIRVAFVVASMSIGMIVLMGALAIWTNRPISGYLILSAPGWIASAAFASIAAMRRSPRKWALLVIAAESILIAAIALAGPPGSKPQTWRFAQSKPDDLVVMSWNCGLGNPYSRPSRAEDLPAISRAIAESNADVVCLQEVGDEHCARLLELLGGSWRGLSNEQGNGWSDSVITRLSADLMTITPPQLFRSTAAMKINFRGSPIEMISVHLAPGHAAGTRKEQTRSLIEYAASAGHPVLVAGDMNLDPHSFWDRVVPFFTESVKVDLQSASMLSELGLDAGSQGPSTASLSRRIDRILVPREWVIAEYQVLFGKKIGRMDHHPIVVRIRPG